jgi:pimeloyl-ACP methyl ester carboxylesterase
MRLKTLSLLAPLSLAIVAGCGTKSTEALAPSNPVASIETPISFEAKSGETVDAFEGSFIVPENRNAKNSRDISIHYVRFPATSDKPGAPIIYLAGGPGGSGIETAKHDRFPLFMAMREFGDVIAYDQRGTGASNDMANCTSSIIIEDTVSYTDETFADMHREAGQECLKFWADEGIDTLGYTTVQNAHDLDDLRQHLGAEKISLWGISYGSHLSLAALKQMEDRIERVVLASVEGLDQTVKMPAGTDAYFGRLQAAIDTEPQLKAMFPDIDGLMRRVHARLEAAPMSLTFTTKEGEQSDYLLDRMDTQMFASGMIADPKWALRLLAIYAALDGGNTEPLQQILTRFVTPNEAISFRPMSFNTDVASGISKARHALIKQQAQDSLLRDYLNFPMPQLDLTVPGLDLGDAFREKPVSDVPTLVLSGTLDGRTYVESQQEAVIGLKNAELVTVINAGHNLFMSSPEVTTTIQEFMRGEPVHTHEIKIDMPGL